jgi:pimeloyl-ACP methyl ester carboxylesterase/CheY-like chemotaxis protein
LSSVKATTQLTQTSNIIDENVMDAAKKKRKKGASFHQLQPTYAVVDNENKVKENVFPDPFKCKGDYCKVRLQPLGALYTDPGWRSHSYEKFFTDKEIAFLRKNKDFNKMMEFGADGPALAVINQKNIMLAREERRGLDDVADLSKSWDVYPVSPRKFGVVKGKVEENTEMSEESKKEFDVRNNLSKDKAHREDFTKSMINYYEQVRICGMCHNVYAMLDWARVQLGKGDAHGAWKEKTNEDGTENPVESTQQVKLLKTGGRKAALLKSSSVNELNKPHSRGNVTNNMAQTLPTSPNAKSKRNHDKSKKTWKSYNEAAEKAASKSTRIDSNKFADLDDYLRGAGDTMAARKERQKEEFVRKRMSQLRAGSETFEESEGELIDDSEIKNMYRGQVLLAFEESPVARESIAILEEAFFDVHWAKDGRCAVNDYIVKEGGFDCILIQGDCPLNDSFHVVEVVRQQERLERNRAAKEAAARGSGLQPITKRHPVICFTNQTTPENLKAYMKADMDGCVSFPVNKSSLLSTIRAAIPHHLAAIAEPEPPPPPEGAKVYKMGGLGEFEGSNDSATQAAKTLAISSGSNDEDCSFSGIVQVDADTRVPYIIMDAARNSKVAVSSKRPFFNLVVCHDLFDTAERLKIFLRPIVQRYLGMQVLLWNQAGQAFTEWRDEQLLNNEYQSTILNEVLGQLGDKGTNDFDTSRPFYLLGFGSGSSIATFYSAHYRVPNLRGIVSINGWSYLDSYLAGVMHDCINIFTCAPPSRPDLPVYFFSRFLFSKEYLAKVSVPLALNIYTAVHNPISLTGRIALCRGTLQTVDVRPLLKEIDCPLICIHSTQDSLARPLHTEPFVSYRAGEVRSIFKVLAEPAKTCVVWMKGGHEVFQENKKETQVLLEQILTGFHESHDISFPPSSVVDKNATEQGSLVSKLPWDQDKKLQKTVEDKFIDNVLGTMNSIDTLNASKSFDPNASVLTANTMGTANTANTGNQSNYTGNQSANTDGTRTVSSPNGKRNKNIVFSSNDPNTWNDFSESIADGQNLGKKAEEKKKNKDKYVSQFVTDPSLVAFERQDSITYGAQQRNNSNNITEYPEIKEFMGWRLKRNKKRLQRLQGAARSIQGGFRAFLARKFVKTIRRRKAAITIQNCFRGWIGRVTFLGQARRIWASQVMQRAWRGYLGRKWYFLLKLKMASSATLQRCFRGYRARCFVYEVKRVREKAACLIQSMFLRNEAKKEAFRRRHQRNASITIQRTYRGHLGKRKALSERDKYIFSRSQSQGIEFGRQMLLEHKLHATRLQSDVTLLTQEKVAAEEHVEALLEEISSFEEGVRTLEKEMHQLAKVEAEAAAYMDDESKFELREQKIKLDKEFGEMLGKIGNRKDMLNDLERKLGSVDKSRQNKEEELRTLERKLVVLLEEQQNELNAIKRKQDVRGAMLAASHEELMKATSGTPGGQLVTTGGGSSGGGGGGGGGDGPSMQEKKQAAQLMQSTETLMKFGFMSMSMTYFSSLNMVKALRTVSAQDTVMAALSDVHSQRAAGGGGGGGEDGGSMSKGQFLPDLKGGQLSGQEALRVSAWSVDDVAKWLSTLSLGQYSESFIDAAIDGEFLYDINDEDLKNTLGIEHRLHRKKILNCVHRLKISEAQRDERLNKLLQSTGTSDVSSLGADENKAAEFPPNPFKPNEGGGDNGEGGADDRRHIDGPKVPLPELFSLVRHSKMSLVKEALDYLPNKKFEKSLVTSNYVVDTGTVYVVGYERLPFHINKIDEHGNNLLSLACQNGNVKMAKYLVAKGANCNHQNKMGQTPAHFAISYKFFELSQWIFENGGVDTLENKFGLTAYDGLNPEEEED